MTEFTGFPRAGLEFLTTLGTKDKRWFDANRSTYDEHVVEPAKAFVVAMGEALSEAVSPAIEAQPRTNGSIAPINNDVRFNREAPPYKDHLMFKFWEGPDKKLAPTLWIRMSPADGVGFASGMVLDDLDRWRECIAGRSGERFAADLSTLVERTKAEVAGQELKRVPKPYDEGHPRGGLLRHKGFQVRWLEPTPKAIESSRFVGWCATRLARTADVHRWLVENLT